ncbi:E3 ubiquitin-protein ligase KCMF1-like [Culex quinquefasciatus]|uniref:E3 ubiquitin-protein ligase KCMF1-like n=1 Tax=Culex quinquefasciatus TaxID=7176 RepID=UPI0018E30214|nr:E3 ubiquitin-protein ligase KCMF1-like [Culex quinquefasciatus]
MSEIHWGIVCDHCEKASFGGFRVACLVCRDYDLCEECHRKKRVSLNHQAYHPMLMIPPPKKMNEILDHPEQTRIFRCPNCGDGNFNVQELSAHCLEYHSYKSCKVRCPICVTFRTEGRKGWIAEDTLLLHLLASHQNDKGFVLGAVGRNGNQECSVCIEEITVENFKRLICGHAFHVACINTWLQENNNCPMCRTEIN